MGVFKKKYIDEIKPYVPGKPIDEVKRELGLSNIIKLASNENASGVSSLVKKKIIENLDLINQYPDGASFRLRNRLAEYLNVDADEIILGNGSNEIIELIARGFIDHEDEVVSSQYTFLVYPILTKVCDGRYREVPAKDYAYDLKALADAITDKTKVVFLANPNNPTGTYFTKKEFDSFLKKVPARVLVVLDEAYVDFVDEPDYPNGRDYFRQKNIVVLRTFSKAFGIAGLRIGYALANKDLVTYFNKIRQPFNTNMLAQIAAEAVLDDTEYYQNTLAMVEQGKEFFYDEFDMLGLEYIKSQANFILVNIKVDSKDFFEQCLLKGIVVRDMKAYTLDNFVRITIGTREENARAISVIKELIG